MFVFFVIHATQWQNFDLKFLRRDYRKNFLWAPCLWVGRRGEPFFGYLILKAMKKENSCILGLKCWLAPKSFVIFTQQEVIATIGVCLSVCEQNSGHNYYSTSIVTKLCHSVCPCQGKKLYILGNYVKGLSSKPFFFFAMISIRIIVLFINLNWRQDASLSI